MSPTSSDIDQAAALLRSGELVAFPTETVYGLGADATSTEAVKKIYQAKGRPSNNPLIVHLGDIKDVTRYVEVVKGSRVEEQFQALAPLWPGPLTIVFPQKKEVVSEITSAGLPSLGIRIPSHPVAHEFLRAVDLPVAAPSANRSQYVSATTVEHVRSCFGDELFVLDGGASELGLESTIVRITEERPAEILRHGYISEEQVRECLGNEVRGAVPQHSNNPLSPGQTRVHYSPKTPLRFLSSTEELIKSDNVDRSKVGVITFSSHPELSKLFPNYHTLSKSGDQKECAQTLYRTLRELDKANLIEVFIERPQQGPLYPALVDRLERAVYKEQV